MAQSGLTTENLTTINSTSSQPGETSSLSTAVTSKEPPSAPANLSVLQASLKKGSRQPGPKVPVPTKVQVANTQDTAPKKEFENLSHAKKNEYMQNEKSMRSPQQENVELLRRSLQRGPEFQCSELEAACALRDSYKNAYVLQLQKNKQLVGIGALLISALLLYGGWKIVGHFFSKQEEEEKEWQQEEIQVVKEEEDDEEE
jgi:hypothetical protein